MNDEEIKQNAVQHARKIKKDFARKFTQDYAEENFPVSVFMAGCPGAGKTESSKRLLEDYKFPQKVMRIDADEFRNEFIEHGYTGNNSHLFHYAVSILASAIHDESLNRNQSFIFDGTFANLDIARDNIKRSLKRKRFVQIFYVYQDPVQAWNFVQEREKKEGRKIEKEDFIKKHFSAREVVNQMKKEFIGNIRIDLLVKNVDGSDRFYKENIDSVDNHLSEKYTKETLEEII